MNRFKWEAERQANERYLKNIMEYKPRRDMEKRGTSKMASGVLSPDELDPEYARESRERAAAATSDDDHFPESPGAGAGAGRGLDPIY